METTKLDRTQAPAAAPMVNVPFPKVSHHVLDNGIPVYTVQFGSQEIVELNAIFPAGMSFEPASGVANFTTWVMQEGTENYTGLEFAKALDGYGASLGAETGYESATFHLSTLTKHLGSTIPLMVELLCRPTFPQKELDILKELSIRNLEIEQKKTAFMARRAFNRMMNGADHPYGRMVDIEDIQKLDLNELRSFYQRNLSLTNCRLIATGRFDEQRLLDLLNQQMGATPFDPQLKVDPTNSAAKDALPEKISGLHVLKKEDSMQATVRVGHQGTAIDHDDYFSMQVVNTILGGYFGSRLMRNIREEKGFTYGIYSAWRSMKYGGNFVIQTDVGNEYVRPTLDEIRKEINLLINEGVGHEELELVKNYMLGRSASSRETPSQILSLIRTYLVNELDFADLDRKFELIRAVGPEDVKEMAARYLRPDDLLEVVAGNIDE